MTVLAKVAALGAIFAVMFIKLAVAEGESLFLSRARSRSVSLKVRAAEFQAAASAVMGCGTESAVDLLEIQRALEPMWAVLPKNRFGNVEWKMVRFVAHRYFMRKSGLLIRGLEPSRKVNDTQLGEAEILQDKVPGFVEILRSGVQQEGGFTLADVAALVATLEQLIFDSEAHTLEAVYRENGLTSWDEVPLSTLFTIVEEYMVNWVLSEDPKSIHRIMHVPKRISDAIPEWAELREYASGFVLAHSTAQQRSPSRAGFVGVYSFQDAHQVVAGITQNFAFFWRSECQSVKESLVKLDSFNSGRVNLAQFFRAYADGQWQFGESEAYLQELGALESGPLGSNRVLISNYLQSASNCAVARDKYMVCCMNECEAYLDQLEESIGAPAAQPELILGFVQNMTNFDDDTPAISSNLREQLERIASVHGGSVPLHGRLFALWLHHVFPHECAFPHKVGTVTAMGIREFGSQSLADSAEVKRHAASRDDDSDQVELESATQAQWMSTWSEEEELHADYSFVFGLTQKPIFPKLLFFGASLFGLASSAWAAFGGQPSKAHSSDVKKSHFV